MVYVLDKGASIQHKVQSKKDGKDQESIQSSTTPDPEYQWVDMCVQQKFNSVCASTTKEILDS